MSKATEDSLPSIFAACCGSDKGMLRRYELSKPFWRDGYAYASDGAIMVRTPCRKFACPERVPNLPDQLFKAWAWRDKPISIVGEMYERGSETKLGHGWWRTSYLTMLRNHGVTEVRLAKGKPSKYPCRFEVGEVEGLLMPCEFSE